jgi:hypothetical protein
LIAIEKMLPWKAVANRGIGALLIALGVSVALWPGHVPGLTLPSSTTAQNAMRSMHSQRCQGNARPPPHPASAPDARTGRRKRPI